VHFDHNKKKHFSLSGKHADLRCVSCHQDDFKKPDIDSSCYSCHKKEDIHKSRQGTKCESCHNQDGWKEATGFDHGLTNFPLLGLHTVASCGECHISLDFKEVGASCFSCHRNDDYHKGILGKDCAKCHNPNGWSLWEFDHNTQSAFKLEGAHAGLECQACHHKPIGKDNRLSGRCFSCHENDDRHDGGFGENCDQCHTVESFKKIGLLNKS